MRWTWIVMALLLVTAMAPTADAARNCSRERVTPYYGLEFAIVETCDANYDQIPDSHEVYVPMLELTSDGVAYDKEDRDPGETKVESETTAGYPVAPSTRVRLETRDHGNDGYKDRIYMDAEARTRLPGDTYPGLYIDLEDWNGDGIYESRSSKLCTNQLGCLELEDPDDLLRLLPRLPDQGDILRLLPDIGPL